MAEYIVRETAFPVGGTMQEVVGELVRCKDCKHNSLKRVSGNVFCGLGHAFSQLHDFCSDGERREDG